MPSLTVELVTPEALKFTGQADLVELPGILGVMGILPNHAALVSMLNPGIIKVRSQNETLMFAAAQGFATIANNKVVCLVDDAVEYDKVDVSRIAEQIQQLQEQLEESNDERLRNQLAFLKAQVSLKG